MARHVHPRIDRLDIASALERYAPDARARGIDYLTVRKVSPNLLQKAGATLQIHRCGAAYLASASCPAIPAKLSQRSTTTSPTLNRDASRHRSGAAAAA